MRTSLTTIDAGMTLDDITNAHPAAIEVFNRFGIDICCGGDVTLAVAAVRDNVPLDVLLRALDDVVFPARET